MARDALNCHFCGEPIKPRKRINGKPQKYCSTLCQSKGWKRSHPKVMKEANHRSYRKKVGKYEGPNGPGHIYAITHYAFPGWVKIGRAVSPKARLNHYNVGCPFRGYRLEFSILVPNMASHEAYLHNKFAEYQSSSGNEWFQVPVEDVLAALEPLAKEDDPHDAE